MISHKFVFLYFRPIAGGEDGGEEVDGGGEIDYADQESTEEEFDEFPVIGSCRALYQFEGN